jgi:hypothetical protein
VVANNLGITELTMEEPFEEALSRIDTVLSENRKIEWLYIILTSILFIVGIVCIVIAIVSSKFAWSIPSAFTTFFLKWPLTEIKRMREKNIALAAAPALITTLPANKAAVEIQKLLQNLYGKENDRKR